MNLICNQTNSLLIQTGYSSAGMIFTTNVVLPKAGTVSYEYTRDDGLLHICAEIDLPNNIFNMVASW